MGVIKDQQRRIKGGECAADEEEQLAGELARIWGLIGLLLIGQLILGAIAQQPHEWCRVGGVGSPKECQLMEQAIGRKG